MKETLLNRINEIRNLAKHSKTSAPASTSVRTSKETALSKVIKTKEDADLFMKRLRALG